MFVFKSGAVAEVEIDPADTFPSFQNAATDTRVVKSGLKGSGWIHYRPSDLSAIFIHERADLPG